ncbi:protein saal1-like [Anneissia japonica]|uniref:protein saal1-like n=1 Tax=Anneissia japonica TaxID=1529436 RepID=UPI001425559E|nr:protein saal1-like [Anneissia japonica]
MSRCGPPPHTGAPAGQQNIVARRSCSSQRAVEMDRNPSPLPEELIDQDVLRADIIGSTVFSKQWVLASLMNLLKGVEKESSEKGDDEENPDSNGIEMDQELEEELCKLWDMSANEEVVAFLHEWKSADMLINVVAKTNSPRTTEICVGILANMACIDQMRKDFAENQQLRDLVLALLEGRDPPTLVEVSRLLHACITDQTTAKPWLTAIKQNSSLETLTFILLSSTNSELLFNVSCLFDVLLDSDQDVLVSLSNSNFIQAVVEANKQVRKEKEECHDMLLHCLQILSTEQEGVRVLVECCSKVFPILYEYLETICEEDVVTIIGRERALSSVVSILQVLLVNSDMGDDEQVSKLFKFLLSILSTLKSTSTSNSTKVAVGIEKSTGPEDKESYSAQDNGTAKEENKATTTDATDTPKSDGSYSTSNVKNHHDNVKEGDVNEQTTMLLSLLTEFFVEVNQGEKTSLLRQLKSCSPTLLKTLSSHLQDAKPDFANLLHQDKT